jgi:tetratricopeptide (TPR) repeat protein
MSAAREHYDRSLEIREEIARQNPGHNHVERDLLLSYNKLGTFHLLQRKDPAAARALFERALAEFERRLLAEPKNIVAMEDLAATRYYVATALLRVGDRKAAAHHYKACLTIREGMPGDAKAKLYNIDLMLARARCGSHQEAAKIAQNLISAPPLDARVYFFAACGFSLSAGAVAEEPPSPEAKALARRYTENALKSLRLALSAGWKNLVDVQTDPDLDAVRNAPEFAAVVAEYRESGGK